MCDASAVNWSVGQVFQWAANSFPEFPAIAQALQNNEVNGRVLLTLTPEELRVDLGIAMLGPRKMVLEEIKILQGLPDSAPTPETGRFLQLLHDGGVNNPNEEVLSKIAIHFSAQLTSILDINNPRIAVQLYNEAKLLPGTSTKEIIQNNTHVSLKGPLNVELYGVKILSGVDEHGRPIVVKVLGQVNPGVLMPEKDAVQGLDLEHVPSDIPVVPCRVAEAKIPSKDEPTTEFIGVLYCTIMPHYPASLALLPQLPSSALLAGASAILRGLEYLHNPNIFVDMDGKWNLGDFDTCVKIGANVIGHTAIFIKQNYEGMSAKRGMDFYMLAVTLLVESDKQNIPQNSFSRIRGTGEYASHALVLSETERVVDSELKDKIKVLLGMAQSDGI